MKEFLIAISIFVGLIFALVGGSMLSMWAFKLTEGHWYQPFVGFFFALCGCWIGNYFSKKINK